MTRRKQLSFGFFVSLFFNEIINFSLHLCRRKKAKLISADYTDFPNIVVGFSTIKHLSITASQLKIEH
jgi:hypothetical protein